MLATILHIEGSSYSKAGTSMLILEDGTQIGLLSGGCLEEDLALRAEHVLEQERTQMLTYDLRGEDDLGWGQGAGCNGKIEVILEPVTQTLRNHLIRVETCLQQGKPVLIVKHIRDGVTNMDYLFITQDQERFGEWKYQVPNVCSRPDPFQQLRQHANQIIKLPDIHTNVFVQLIQPKPRLIIFGAGADVRPLVTFAARIGFTVTVTDWRPVYCNRIQIPDADVLIQGYPEEAVQQLSLKPNDLVVVMTHNFQRDQEILQLLTRYRLLYLGILGTHSRTIRLFGGHDIPEGIHSPIGLPIGSEGPEEIAVSILAELIQTIRRGNSRQKIGC
jgi:xanthine dehydrogenase accessory factor